jgi:hypothetical protein
MKNFYTQVIDYIKLDRQSDHFKPNFPPLSLFQCQQWQLDMNPQPWDDKASVLPLCSTISRFKANLDFPSVAIKITKVFVRLYLLTAFKQYSAYLLSRKLIF